MAGSWAGIQLKQECRHPDPAESTGRLLADRSAISRSIDLSRSASARNRWWFASLLEARVGIVEWRTGTTHRIPLADLTPSCRDRAASPSLPNEV